jgi:Zn-dependent protease
MFSRGYLTVAHLRGVPIRFHWSAPLGALVWTGGDLSWVRVAAFLGIVLLHELGHATLVWRSRARVTEINVHAMGGECGWRGQVSPAERALIAFGGVWAQALLALGAWIMVRALPGVLSYSLIDMLLGYNLYMAAFNLLPVAPLDGAEAWKLLPLWWRDARTRSHKARELRQVQREMKRILLKAARKTNNPVTPIRPPKN